MSIQEKGLSVDSRGVYFDNASKRELLSAEDEIQLSQEIGRGRLAEVILTRLTESDYRPFYFGKFSDKARKQNDEVILEPPVSKRRVKHAAPIAKHIADDLISDIGLTNHIELTVENDLQKETESSGDKGEPYKRMVRRLTQHFGRVPTEEEIATEETRLNKVVSLAWRVPPGEEIDQEEIEHRLEKEIYVGVRAKEKFIEHNLRLAAGTGRQFQDFGITDTDDYIQDSNTGLIRAVEMFDWRMGYKFSTYATIWIRKEILDAKPEARTIRKPREVEAIYVKITKAIAVLMQGDKTPNSIEIAKEVGISPEQVDEILEIYRSQETVSLETKLESKEGHEVTLYDRIEDNTSANRIVEIDNNNSINSVLTEMGLSAHEIEVIKLSFGFVDGDEWESSQIAAHLGVHAATIRKRKSSALEKLRSSGISPQSFSKN